MGIIFDIQTLHLMASQMNVFFTVSTQTLCNILASQINVILTVLCKILASKMNVIFGIIQSDIVLQTHKPNRYNF